MDGSHRVPGETPAPSTLEKEDPLGRRNLYPSAFAAAIAVFFVLSPFASPAKLCALDIGLGGRILRSLSSSEIESMSRPLALGAGKTEKTVALGELCPLLSEVWRIEVSSAKESKVWEAEDLGEGLFEIHLAKSGSGWDLVSGQERIRGVERIDLSGERLTENDLEIWISWEGVSELKEEISRFAASQGLRLRVSDVPNTQTKLLAVARARGQLPDLVMIQSDYVPALAAAGAIQSVEYLKTADLVPKGFEAFRHGGKFWAVPFYFDTQLVFYNRRLAGGDIPDAWTTDDLERMATKLTGGAGSPGQGRAATGLKAPMAWNVYSAYWLLPFMAGFGKTSILNPDASITVDDAPTAAALTWLLDLAKRGLLEPAERDAMISWFAAGKTAFILSGSYSIPEFSKLGIDFGVAPYPTLGATGRALAPLLDFKGLAIGRRTTKPVLARRLVQFLTSPGLQASFTSKLAKLPASRIAMESSKTENRYYAQLRRSYEIGMAIPPAESYAAFKNVMWKLLRFLFTGQMDVATMLKTAAAQIAENLK
jgi:arabinogalactan oligomer/maltooligosaccharide transport system substrate-binding protein